MKNLRKILAVLLAASLLTSVFALSSCSVLEQFTETRRHHRDRDDDDDEDDEDDEDETTETEETDVTELTETRETEPSVTEESGTSETTAEQDAGDAYMSACGFELFPGRGDYYGSDDTIDICVRQRYETGDGDRYYSYPELLLSPASQERFPQLQQTLVSWLNLYFSTLAGECSASDELGNRVNVNFHVRRADSSFLSGIMMIETDNGIYYAGGQTTDPQTGETVFLEDVVADTDRLWEILAENGYYISSVPEFNGKQCSFTVDPTSVTFIILEEDVPYVQHYVSVPIAGNEDMFTDIVTSASYDWAMELCEEDLATPVYADLGNNGTLDTILVDTEVDEYGFPVRINVNVNGASANAGETYMECYGIDSVNLLQYEGGYYLFITVCSENDYRFTYEYRIAEDSVSYMDSVSGAFTGAPIEANNIYYSENEGYVENFETALYNCVLTDAENVFIDRNIHMLGTYSILYPASYTEDGAFPDGIWDIDDWGVCEGFNSYRVITALQNIDTISFPDGDDATIHEGAQLRIVYAYAPSFSAVLQDMESGDLYYISYDSAEDFGIINGTAEEELFSGLYYAG